MQYAAQMQYGRQTNRWQLLINTNLYGAGTFMPQFPTLPQSAVPLA